jgi:hypothetical protein
LWCGIILLPVLHVLLVAEAHDKLQQVHLHLDVGGVVAHKEPCSGKKTATLKYENIDCGTFNHKKIFVIF